MNTNFIWYASYGSNISEDRFLCYIRGGKPIGATRTYEGCSDKSLPLDNKGIQIPHELYFAQKAKVWDGGGVAFIKPEISVKTETLGRMYLITKAQFAEVVMQENALKQPSDIPFEKAMETSGIQLTESGWYNYLLYLGKEKDYPIFTFTHDTFMEEALNPPKENYLNTIAKGIKETFPYDEEKAILYLQSKF